MFLKSDTIKSKNMNNTQVLFEKYLMNNSREGSGKFHSYNRALKKISDSIGCDIFEITDDAVLAFLAKISKNASFIEDDSYRNGGFISAAINIYRKFLKGQENKEYEDFKSPVQQIYYGAPGTGKSHEIKKLTSGKDVIRTTFHPDSDYSTFVGAYKPTTKEIPLRDLSGHIVSEGDKQVTENRIVYSFVKQAFLKAYLGAWKKYTEAQDGKVESQFLIIEEINRGNCAQIFGDLFQLLDRADNGFSEYPIEADSDIQKAIAKSFASGGDFELVNNLDVDSVVEGYKSIYGSTLSEDIKEGHILLLPNNLYIWATMNTSDQSLFPIDSAFKRRWDWKYVKIKNENKDWRIAVNYNLFDWWSFLKKINDIIYHTTNSEDKQLGYFFAKAKDNVISAEIFVSKVLFYLWNDVFKDYGFTNEIFVKEQKADKTDILSFHDFYNDDNSLNIDNVEQFLNNLGLEVVGTTREDEDTNGKTETERDQIKTLRQNYWQKYLEYARQRPDYMQYFAGVQTPSKEKWLNYGIGEKDCYLTINQTRQRNELSIGLYFDNSTTKFQKLYEQKNNIEKELQVTLKWDEKSEKKASSIFYIKPDIDFDNENDQERQFKTYVDMLIKMRDVFKKYL